jgi:nucleoside-diphosphate-sugar epimerase
MTTAHSAPTPAPKIALVIGATGSFGAHAAQALIKHGWSVRAMSRHPEAARAAAPRAPIDWIKGDAMNPGDVIAAAQDVQLIVHAANPPKYHNWPGTVLPMVESAIAAAKASGARLMMPTSVYNFAPNFGPEIGEDAPQVPVTRKGRIRVAVERRLRRAAEQEGVRVLLLRAGDYFGPAAPNSALSWLITRSGERMTGVYQPGPDKVGHAFAYLPDLAEALARVLDAEGRLAAFESLHFRGHFLERNDTLGLAIRRVSGGAELPIRPFPWPLVWALSPFVELFRELWEMRYLWRRPIGLANGRLVALIGSEPHTPLDAALGASLADMGLIGGPMGESRPAPAAARVLARA